MGFLPDDYAPPQSGNYMKLQVGDNRVRILGSAVVGNEFWTNDEQGNRKPVRRRMHETIHGDELGVDQHGKQERPRHFWAFPVWNYQANQVQILELTQKTVQDAILALVESSDWGDPKGYDILIRKQGSGLDTEYTVMPGKPGDPPADAQREFLRCNVNMDALFENGDPFADAEAGTTPENPPQQDQAPQGGSETVTVNEIENKGTNQGTVYMIHTSNGVYGTFESAHMYAAKHAQESGGQVKIDYTVTEKGGSKIVKIEPVQTGSHEPIEESDIPF